jgi:hypothetical protein
MLSGCRHTGGAYYKTSSWQFYNPFSSKSKNKDIDDVALVQQFEEPSYNLPKSDVTTPRDGYSNNPPRETRVTASNTARDPMNDLHNAGLARNTGSPGSSGTSSAQSKPDAIFAQNGASGATTNLPSYGTTTPIDPGLNGTNMNQIAQQQSAQPAFGASMSPGQSVMNQQPGFPAYQADPNAGMIAGLTNQPMVNSSTLSYGQPDYSQPGQQFVIPGQPTFQDQIPYPGQSTNMMVQSANQPQTSFVGTGDPMYGGFSNSAVPMSSNSTQMVASTQGLGYTGQPFGAAAPVGTNTQTPGFPSQTTMPQEAMSQNAAAPNTVPSGAGYSQHPVMGPTGQVTSDPGYGFTNPATQGMPNPSATGTPVFPTTDPNSYGTVQPWPQTTPAQTYPSQPSAAQPTTNNGYQTTGFNYFGPTPGYDYSPGGY